MFAQVSIPRLTLRPLTLDWSAIAAAAERYGRGIFRFRIGGRECSADSTYDLMNEPLEVRKTRAESWLDDHGYGHLRLLLELAALRARRRFR